MMQSMLDLDVKLFLSPTLTVRWRLHGHPLATAQEGGLLPRTSLEDAGAVEGRVVNHGLASMVFADSRGSCNDAEITERLVVLRELKRSTVAVRLYAANVRVDRVVSLLKLLWH